MRLLLLYSRKPSKIIPRRLLTSLSPSKFSRYFVYLTLRGENYSIALLKTLRYLFKT